MEIFLPTLTKKLNTAIMDFQWMTKNNILQQCTTLSFLKILLCQIKFGIWSILVKINCNLKKIVFLFFAACVSLIIYAIFYSINTPHLLYTLCFFNELVSWSLLQLKTFCSFFDQILALICITKGCHTTHHNICALQELLQHHQQKKNPIIINAIKRVP